MIPVRVRIAGFLSYREPQDLDFDTARLWLLAGPNGSGKSALFDAVIWALFNHHRGGSQNAAELLNKHSDRAAVEVDLRCEGALYRVERSLKKTKTGASGSFSIRKQRDGDWIDVPDTHRKAEFEAWIGEHVGLDYDTFTASVLLRQGHAEKLLDATPKGRSEVLANVVRLELIQGLHERAVQERLKRKAIVDVLHAQTEFTGTVSDEEARTAECNRIEAEAAVDAAKAQVSTSETVIDGVRRAALLKERFEEARSKIAAADALMKQSAAIEAEYARLQELAAILPAAETVVVTRGKQSESEHRTERFLKQQEIAKQTKDASERSLTTAKAKKLELTKALATDEAKLAPLGQRLRVLASSLQTVKLVEEQSAEIAKLESDAARFPKTLREQATDAEANVSRLTSLEQALPLMKRLQQEQADREAASERRENANSDCERIRRDGETARASHDCLVKTLADTNAEVAKIETAFMQADAQKRFAENAVESLTTLAQKSQCHFCGQPLTKAHLALETARRESELAIAVAAFEKLIPDREAAITKLAELKEKEAASNEHLVRLRDDYKEHASQRAEAERDLARHDRAIAELKNTLKTFEASLGASEVAAADDVKAELDDAKRNLSILQEQSAQQSSLLQQLSRLKLSRDRLASQLPGDAAALREEQQAKQAEEASLQQAVKAGRKALEEAEREIDKFSRQAHAALTELTDLTGRLRTEESTREHCGEVVGRALAKLTGDWRAKIEAAGLVDFNGWKDEHAALTGKRAAVSYRQLEAARSHGESLREEAARCEAEWRAAEPTTAEEANTRLVASKTALAVAEAALAAARETCRRFEESQTRQQALSEQTRDAERHLARLKRTCDLLGRDGLQRHLVRDAEQRIVERANGVLKSLTGESLILSLADAGEAEKALDLQAVCPAISPEPIGVTFLSGSQRFRLAVALALGIGEFAGDREPPGLMIDEGFGSLDRDGRAAMIRELHTLSERLPRVLVVSHDDDFAATFENVYRFELVDGATRVSRSQ